MVNITHQKPILIWEKHWLKQWDNLEDSDKKVLAALYWDLLTSTQKDEFTDAEYIEFVKIRDKRQAELVNDPVKMRSHFLEEASPLIDQMINAALGTKKMNSQDNYAINEVWNVLKEIIIKANNPAPLIDLRGKDITDQIDQILQSVTTGELDFEQAKEYMSLVSTGFNLQKLPELLSKLEMIEAM